MKRLLRVCLRSAALLASLLLAAGEPVWADSSVVEKVVSAGEELRAPVDCETLQRLNIRLENLVDTESVCWWTSFRKGKERGEYDIGPLIFRTFSLSGKARDIHTTTGIATKSDRKTIQLQCREMDVLLIHVDKGKIRVNVSGKQTRGMESSPVKK